MPRYEVPAMILVDADDEAGAHERALALGATLDRNEDPDPGSSFHGITTAAVKWPRKCEEDREAESLGEHAESLQNAAGLS